MTLSDKCLGIKDYTPENILLVWLGKIGDFVVSTAFIDAVRRKYPDSHLAVMVRPPVDRLAVLADVDEIITFPKGLKSFRNLPEFLNAFFLRKWDMCIDLNPSYSGSSGRISMLSGAEFKVGFANKKSDRYYNCTVHEASNTEHMMHCYARMAELLGLDFDRRMRLSLRECDIEPARRIVTGLGLRFPFMVFHPGNFKKDYSCWGIENFVRLSKDIADKYPEFGQAYLAGPGEEDTVAQMAARINGAVMLPAMSLPVTAALLSLAELTVVNSTGTLHMSEAVGTPTLSFHKGYSYECWRPLDTKGAALCSGDWRSVHPLKYETVWDALVRIVS
jgi:ADP-heptose:LPS heptosyltransferase